MLPTSSRFPAELVYAYYEPVRDLRETNRGLRLPGVSGAPGFVAAALPVDGMSLLAHRETLEVADDPDQLLAVREQLQEEWLSLQSEEEEADDLELSLGLDGLGL